jgi:type 1 glutamine amidotransferase
MNRRVRACSLFVAALVGACGTDGGDNNLPGPAGGAGAASGGSSGAASGTSGATSTGGSGGSAGGGGGGGGGMAGSPTGGTAGAGGGGGTATAGTSGAGGGGGSGGMPNLPKRVLLYHFSTLNIASVPAQLTALSEQLTTWGYETKQSVDPADLSATSLSQFGGVGMINTCFEPFGQNKMGDAEATALKNFVEAGGGLFGTHCASVTFQSANPPHPYNTLIGGRGGGGNFNGLSACTKTSEQHATTAMLATTFDYTGDLDNADYLAPDTKVLIKCTWSGGAQKETAVSWYRTPGKGRVFFTNFAKEDKDLKDATLGAKHILLGLGWVLGR